MAIYHLTASVISRARGQSMVAAAAYRLGAALRDERYGVTHNYTGKRAVAHSQIMAPAQAPPWVHDREALWNTVEAAERRKDSQLARLIEVGLPVELSAGERLALLRDFVAEAFVEEGMIADFCVREDPVNPHAHILLTLRVLTAAGFGAKERRWNGKARLLDWRIAWAERVNEHLARAGHAARVDHRTLAAQQIELTPGRRVGIGAARREGSLPPYLAERLVERQAIAGENGDIILEDPTVAIHALARQKPVFTHAELVQYLRARTQNAAQFEAVLHAVRHCSELVALGGGGGGGGGGGQDRFTSRDMIEAEKSLVRRTASMAARRGHGIDAARLGALTERFQPGDAMRRGLLMLLGGGDVTALSLGGGFKAEILAAAAPAWLGSGLQVLGVAPTRRAARSLQAIAGVESHSLAAREEQWQGGAEVSRDAVVLVDGAHLLGLKQLERVLAVADRARAKAVFVGDADALRADRGESPFQVLMRQIPDSLEVPRDR